MASNWKSKGQSRYRRHGRGRAGFGEGENSEGSVTKSDQDQIFACNNAQALTDFAAGRAIRAVDEDGQIKQLSDKSGEQMVTDNFLRAEYPPAGKARTPRPGDTPTDRFNHRVSELAHAMERLETAFQAVAAVTGDD